MDNADRNANDPNQNATAFLFDRLVDLSRVTQAAPHIAGYDVAVSLLAQTVCLDGQHPEFNALRDWIFLHDDDTWEATMAEHYQEGFDR